MSSNHRQAKRISCVWLPIDAVLHQLFETEQLFCTLLCTTITLTAKDRCFKMLITSAQQSCDVSYPQTVGCLLNQISILCDLITKICQKDGRSKSHLFIELNLECLLSDVYVGVCV